MEEVPGHRPAVKSAGNSGRRRHSSILSASVRKGRVQPIVRESRRYAREYTERYGGSHEEIVEGEAQGLGLRQRWGTATT